MKAPHHAFSPVPGRIVGAGPVIAAVLAWVLAGSTVRVAPWVVAVALLGTAVARARAEPDREGVAGAPLRRLATAFHRVASRILLPVSAALLVTVPRVAPIPGAAAPAVGPCLAVATTAGDARTWGADGVAVEVRWRSCEDQSGGVTTAWGESIVVWRGSRELQTTDGSTVVPTRGMVITVALERAVPPPTVRAAHDDVRVVSVPAGAEFRSRAREYVREALAPLDGTTGGVVVALLLGDRALLDGEIADLFRRAGAAHVLALSGMHLAIFAGALVIPVRLVVRARSAGIVVALLLLPYLWIVGMIPSLIRAWIWSALAGVEAARGRPTPAVVRLARTVLLALILEPKMAEDVGFALSVAAIGGIVVVAPPTIARLARAVPRTAAAPLGVGLAAFATTAPIALSVFDALHPVGILASVPLGIVGTLIVWSGAAAAATSAIPYIGSAIADVVRLATGAMIATARLAARAPGVDGEWVRRAGWYLCACIAILVTMHTFVRRIGPRDHST